MSNVANASRIIPPPYQKIERETLDPDVDDSNRTALHKAAVTGNKDILNMLLSYGGDIFAVSHDGVTALYLAEVMGESEVVEIILQRGQWDMYRLIK